MWQKSLTPVALAATIETQEQTFATAAGDIPEYQETGGQFGQTPGAYGLVLATGDVLLVQPPTGGTNNDKLASASYAYVSTGGVLGTAVITIGFSNATAAANTPAAGTYSFVLVR
jgi:hypothetical protein